MSGYIVKALTFLPEGAVAVEYIEPAVDIRQNGMIVNHGILVVEDEHTADGIDLLLRTAQTFLKNSLREFHASPPGDPQLSFDDVDDDAPGPYDNPDER